MEHFDEEEDLKYNFYKIIDRLHHRNPVEAQNELTTKTQTYKSNIELLIENKMPDYGLMELKKIIPEIY